VTAVRETVVLRGNKHEFPRLIDFAEAFARRCGLPDGERARLLIILEELFTNAVQYGYAAGPPCGRIEIGLAVTPGRIEIDFSDDGRPFDPLAHRDETFDLPPAERAAGGLGLEIVRALVDEAHYCHDGGRNRLALVRRFAT
jgi:anti-sigma regulatory factor (Ser/Thr protein kinase)